MSRDVHAQPLARARAACAPALLAPLHGARLFVTGGTGFLGQWVLRALADLNAQGFGIRLQCASRDPAAFLGGDAWRNALGAGWLACDAAGFAQLRIDAQTTHVLHLAASSDAARNYADPLAACNDILDGTRGCIALARACGAHLHYVSSGAVYGPRKASDGPAREDQVERFAPHPLDPRQAYGNAKRMAEAMVASGLDNFCISRPFAFLGPGLPLDKHFAAGNFVNDAAHGRPIRISGDGTPLRSYMHPADYAVWTLALLAQAPRRGAFNVGADEPVSIAALAHAVCHAAGSPPPQVAG
uniref:NAD-dependent epimerase/dehydratase family protein n=1 Tax=Ramlibacter sp. TaxID=1917967 RepID=UPI0018067C89